MWRQLAARVLCCSALPRYMPFMFNMVPLLPLSTAAAGPSSAAPPLHTHTHTPGAYTRTVSGVQSPGDLETAFQLLHLLFTTE